MLQGQAGLEISIHAPRMGSDTASLRASMTWYDFNPRSPHGERPSTPSQYLLVFLISIHAPRMGSDPTLSKVPLYADYFNPRSPHGERPDKTVSQAMSKLFQSTLPAWGATLRNIPFSYFVSISIHAPRMGSDVFFSKEEWEKAKFQSTLPAWGATLPEYRRRYTVFYFNPRSPHGERRG